MDNSYRTIVHSSIMNDINVPSTDQHAPPQLLGRLTSELGSLTPEVRKAATFVLENPNEVGVSSIREIASAADVKPNTLVRMARVLGFDGYEDFREPFRDEIRRGSASFPDRARWLQSSEPVRQAGQPVCRHGRFRPAQYRGNLCRYR